MLSGLFSISWARTAHHPGENFWIHTCTHVADKQARVMCMFIAYACFVFGSCRSSYSYVMDKMIRGVENHGNKGPVLRENVNIDHFCKQI